MSEIRIPYSSLRWIEEQKREKLLKDARNRIICFTKYTKPDYKINWHHHLTCKYIKKWINGEIQNLLITEPPRHGKSELVSLRTPAYIFGRNPNARVISAAYSADLASKNNRSVQKIIDSEKYRQVFPDTQLSGENVRSVLKGRYLRNSDEFEIVGHNGGYRSAGIGGGITGMGADYLIIDDPIKNDKEADSETFRENLWTWWLSTAFTRLEKHSRVLLTMTRWHEDDLAGRLLAQAKADPSALQWTELKLEAVREDMTNPEDPRAFGEPLWPGKYTQERLKMIESTVGPRWWNSLYQQRPAALEGGEILRAWITDNYYRHADLPAKFDRMAISVDATFKKGAKTDFVVIQVWGMSGRFRYLLHQVRDRMGFVETCDAIKQVMKEYPKAMQKLIETKANGEAIINQFQHEKIPGMTGYNPTESKAARLSACSPCFRAGDVRYPHPDIAPWVQINIEEIVKFGRVAHDDTVDATTQMLIDWMAGANWLADLIGD